MFPFNHKTSVSAVLLHKYTPRNYHISDPDFHLLEQYKKFIMHPKSSIS